MLIDERCRRTLRWCSLALCLALSLQATVASAQEGPPGATLAGDKVQLDFNDVELAVVIDTIARLTNKNFIYDDRVRGRVTIVSPTEITIDEAYAVFESVLQVKGFTTVQGPGGAIKVIPIREAKESNVETVRGPARTPDSDRFITRLIPLQYIDAEAITNTLKPLVSKDASMVAYPPTNTVILTDAATNISRILSILRSIDVETYKEELTVIQLRYADAATLSEQLSEIFGTEPVAAPTRRARSRRAAQPVTPSPEAIAGGQVRILTDERTNSLIVLASRQRTEDIREVVKRLDVPVLGGGRIHVYYLKHADAEELAATLSSLISGQPATPAGGQAQATPQALRAAITELAEGVTVTADPPTNSLVIQASREGYDTVAGVIAALDMPRPQVLVEALVMEVDVSDSQALGFNGLARIFRGNTSYAVGSLTNLNASSALLGSFPGFGQDDGDGENGDGGGIIDSDLARLAGTASGILSGSAVANLVAAGARNTLTFDDDGNPTGGSLIQGIITASANMGGTNILSAPHILTMDNEEAEIRVGANIPIVTSRVQSAAGIETATGNLATSQNIERQDIGITLRVTPQISEGDNLRLRIFQEITDVNLALSAVTGNPQEVGVSLSSRTVENTVVVSDSETVVIGGLISDKYEDNESKVPWLGDIPILGWAFKSTNRSSTKTNLLIFLTPNIIRTEAELAYETIRKREEFWENSEGALDLTTKEKKAQEKRRVEAQAAGLDLEPYKGRNPVRGRLLEHGKRYPVERMREIEEQRRREREGGTLDPTASAGSRYGVLAATFRDEGAAAATLQELMDAGFDGTLVSGDSSGTVLYEVRVGPFDSLEEAEVASSTLADSFDLIPTVTIERGTE
jgi:general secretion pathway protein D